MKAVILNSGFGSRMKDFTKTKHKSMVEVKPGKMLIIDQIEKLASFGIRDYVITTGHLNELLEDTVKEAFGEEYHFTFVFNPVYRETNYILSLYLAREYLNEDLLLLHGDLYFTNIVLKELLEMKSSCVVVDTTLPQPEKDFKAKIVEGKVRRVSTTLTGIDAYALQPLYKLMKKDSLVWKQQIEVFAKQDKIKVYAEEALNVELDKNTIDLYPLDIKGQLCMEVDTLEDLELLKKRIQEEQE